MIEYGLEWTSEEHYAFVTAETEKAAREIAYKEVKELFEQIAYYDAAEVTEENREELQDLVGEELQEDGN